MKIGCFTLHRGVGSAEAIDYERIEAAAYEVGPLATPSWLTHEAGMDTYYAVRRVSGSGKGERGTEAVVRLSLDATGQHRPARPNPVSRLQAAAEANGRIRLCWWYMPLGQEAVPDVFAVYSDAGTDEVDYNAAVGTVAYWGAGFYEYISETQEGGQAYRFSVRSVAADGTDDDSKAWAKVVADNSGPDSYNGVVGRVGL